MPVYKWYRDTFHLPTVRMHFVRCFWKWIGATFRKSAEQSRCGLPLLRGEPRYLAVDEFVMHKGHRRATCVMDLEEGLSFGRTKAGARSASCGSSKSMTPLPPTGDGRHGSREPRRVESPPLRGSHGSRRSFWTVWSHTQGTASPPAGWKGSTTR